MVYYLYILYSATADIYYIGHTNDLGRRMSEHNSCDAGWTKYHQPWALVFREEFVRRSDAMKREKYLKSFKSKERIRQYIDGWRSFKLL